MPTRLANIDIVDLAKPAPAVVTQVVFGSLCALGTVVLRMALDVFLPGAGPFASIMPIVLAATLFGRRLSGLVCQTLAGLYAWYFVLPMAGSFEFASAADGPRVFVNMASGYVIVLLADIFRRAMRDAMKDRELLLYELEHRVKNSFASIVGVLRLQARDAENPEVREALEASIRRVNNYSLAYGFLSHRMDGVGKTRMDEFLGQLCRSLESAVPGEERVRFSCRSDVAELARDKAVMIGLLVNEITTNSIKHAFGDEGGNIAVEYTVDGDSHILCVADNGRGIGGPVRKGALGLRLIEAMTQQLEGHYEVDGGDAGTRFTFRFPARAA
ncbi:MAG: sensor histidine kinase [Parvularcula sp.]|jgi:two-component sensor histidine kinase|nr:sensor histidine kinase [Parvularcula sp.]